jgi:hypothetical protein
MPASSSTAANRRPNPGQSPASQNAAKTGSGALSARSPDIR